ncbi:hypothetical protein ES288_A10G112000v1 [Gossypium darwinii]|nr:hypothetical protein ES288_A10G112000v1 [Gossypium darwinii]TYI05754.1 hypothetical protein ES332_A10G111700v1 [Gossypium tomentosum]
MPPFTAIALDRLIESGDSKSVDKSSRYLKPPIPPNSKLRRRNSTSAAERKGNRPQISPALYATPDATPLPDSTSFFPSSPYIVNHKRRGPCLSRSSSEILSRQITLEEDEVNSKIKVADKASLAETKYVDLSKDGPFTSSVRKPNEEKHRNGVFNGHVNAEKANVHGGSIQDEHKNGVGDGELGGNNGEVGSCLMSNGLAKDRAVPNVGPPNSDRYSDKEDFFDLNESTSATSNTDGDDHTAAEGAGKSAASGVEFYDAWDELSSNNAPHTFVRDIEAELREIRSNLLVEIEKRKKAEETLNQMRCKWQRISQEFAVAGLALPVDPVDATDDELVKPVEELRQQESVARLVSLSVGRGVARAEMQMEMESQIKLKNFEVARLLDRLHYYKAVNQEMSQRNQEAIEMARRDRQRKKRRQKWVWGSIAAAITLGMTALAWSYLPSGKASSASSARITQAPVSDDAITKTAK